MEDLEVGCQKQEIQRHRPRAKKDVWVYERRRPGKADIDRSTHSVSLGMAGQGCTANRGSTSCWIFAFLEFPVSRRIRPQGVQSQPRSYLAWRFPWNGQSHWRLLEGLLYKQSLVGGLFTSNYAALLLVQRPSLRLIPAYQKFRIELNIAPPHPQTGLSLYVRLRPPPVDRYGNFNLHRFKATLAHGAYYDNALLAGY